MKRKFKFCVSIFLVGIILGLSSIPVFAGITESPWGYYGPISGYSYKNHALLDVSTNGQNALTSSYKDGSGTVPAGYMGAQARLFKNDALYKYSSMLYNSSASSTLVESTGYFKGGSGTYYSYGITAAYNGNGYDTFYTFKSPSQSN
jgi:hypothetical protein